MAMEEMAMIWLVTRVPMVTAVMAKATSIAKLAFECTRSLSEDLDITIPGWMFFYITVAILPLYSHYTRTILSISLYGSSDFWSCNIIEHKIFDRTLYWLDGNLEKISITFFDASMFCCFPWLGFFTFMTDIAYAGRGIAAYGRITHNDTMMRF
jgi:hypothetical protein